MFDAAQLRSEVRDRVGLPITVGVARTKFLAKVASQEAKPDGLLVTRKHPAIRAIAGEAASRIVWYDTGRCDGWWAEGTVYEIGRAHV